MSSKYADIPSTVQLIGCLLKKPSLLEEDGTHFFLPEDFPDDFHYTIFSAINNLYQMGAEVITTASIEDYLSSKPMSLARYKEASGAEWITNTRERADLENFEFYYNRIKKMTLLRKYAEEGIDISEFIDRNDMSPDRLEEQAIKLDELELSEIADRIEEKVEGIRNIYIEDSTPGNAIAVGDVVDDVLESLRVKPAIGLPIYDTYQNTAFRGARLGKLYIRSAATSVGKTRSMVADACSLACDELYDGRSWHPNGNRQPTLFIATEQDITEITTMCIAFLANVNESHILWGEYVDQEEFERVRYAADLLKKSPLYVVELPDFDVRDIENTIKRHLRQHKVQYFFFDYIHSSPKILAEITRKSGGVKLAEHNILFMFATALKNLCVEYNIFIMTATQLNGKHNCQ